ncbi:vWA domain-containing protein [Allochromatium palmeri]|nr:vWA domain-containing protein [Allochromatium palmeri]
MRSKRASIGSILSLFAVIVITCGSSPATAAVDVALALDRSLSMNSNDPGRDSLKGAELFTELLQSGDRLSLLTFGQDAQILMPLKALNAQSTREQVLELVRRVTMDGTRTDFSAALRGAYKFLASSGRDPDAKRILVLFTDGQLNLGSEAATEQARAEIINQLIPRFQAAGIQIHGVAFSPEGDIDFLRLLTDSTGGQAFRAERPEDIYPAFVKLFEQADQPLTAPVVEGRVEVDANVRELKLLVQRDANGAPTRLTDPSQRELTADDQMEGVTWRRTEHFDHITIQQPEAGSWQISGESLDERAYLESDLDLEAKLPVLATVDEAVTVAARLVYRGQGVDERLASNTAFSATVLDTAGTPKQRLDLKPDMTAPQTTRRHQGQLNFTDPGPYQVRVTAESESFQRTKLLSMSLLPADQPPATDDDVRFDDDQHLALAIVIGGNLILLVVGGSLGGLWWWRRRQKTGTRRNIDDL